MSNAFPPPQAPPPGSYTVPVGGYRAPVGAYQMPPTAPRASSATGTLALVAALLASVVSPLLAGLLALGIGTRTPFDMLITASGDLSLSALTPVRTEVLWIEILFWAATVIGILAFVLGITAAVRRRGRGPGIAAIVLATIGPGGFLLSAWILFAVGTALGTTAGP
ncbi:hypothetical protein [Microbacterium soli]|uniref:Uncharacterized protein n=1 Tax=Microbacterium soli TaxID=446075 RepID=A0ABP7NEA7_9MICO